MGSRDLRLDDDDIFVDGFGRNEGDFDRTSPRRPQPPETLPEVAAWLATGSRNLTTPVAATALTRSHFAEFQGGTGLA